MKSKIKMFALVTLLTGGLILTGCSNESTSTSVDPEIYAIYQEYAASTSNPLSYEEWLATIKGDKGDKGDTGETGATGAAGATGETGATGSKGDTGSTGATGATGKTGASIITGKGAPASTVGTDGDTYINSETGEIYTKVSGAWVLTDQVLGSECNHDYVPVVITEDNDYIAKDGILYRTDTVEKCLNCGKTIYHRSVAATFDGGLGTSESPFLISSVDEFNQITTIQDAMVDSATNLISHHLSFKLTADIVPTATSHLKTIELLQGDIDGGGFKLGLYSEYMDTVTGGIDGFLVNTLVGNCSIKNINLDSKDGAFCVYANVGFWRPASFNNGFVTTFDNVTATGSFSTGNNSSIFIGLVNNDIIFQNCTNSAKTVSTAYVGAFIGGYMLPVSAADVDKDWKHNATFTNCIFSGSIIADIAAGMLMGNHTAFSRGSHVNYHVIGCVNNGVISAPSVNLLCPTFGNVASTIITTRDSVETGIGSGLKTSDSGRLITVSTTTITASFSTTLTISDCDADITTFSIRIAFFATTDGGSTLYTVVKEYTGLSKEEVNALNLANLKVKETTAYETGDIFVDNGVSYYAYKSETAVEMSFHVVKNSTTGEAALTTSIKGFDASGNFVSYLAQVS
jgi:hypothetical protein